MLSWQTYIAKFIGLTAMLCSGLSLGKEGPFVHLSSIIAEILPWRWLHGENNTLRHQLLTAAIAVGVTATFGAPIGGVLFSIELTTATYNISNLWKAFYSAFIAVVLFRALGTIQKIRLFNAEAGYFYREHQQIGLNIELLFYFMLAIILGLIGSFFIYILRVCLTLKKQNKGMWIFDPWFYSITIALFILNVQFFTKLTQVGDKEIISSLIAIDENYNEADMPLMENIPPADWSHFDLDEMKDKRFWLSNDQYLASYVLMKFVFTVLTLTMNVPAGTFMPVFTLGMAAG